MEIRQIQELQEKLETAIANIITIASNYSQKNLLQSLFSSSEFSRMSNKKAVMSLEKHIESFIKIENALFKNCKTYPQIFADFDSRIKARVLDETGFFDFKRYDLELLLSYEPHQTL